MRHMRFTEPLFAACVGQVISLCACVCMWMFVCDCVCLCVSVSVCLSRREWKRMKAADWSSAGVGRVVGWQMPEGFIRLEGRGREQQFSGKSIRPKHKHRHASNPGLALHSIFHSFLFFFLSLSVIPTRLCPPFKVSNAISSSSSSLVQ